MMLSIAKHKSHPAIHQFETENFLQHQMNAINRNGYKPENKTMNTTGTSIGYDFFKKNVPCSPVARVWSVDVCIGEYIYLDIYLFLHISILVPFSFFRDYSLDLLCFFLFIRMEVGRMADGCELKFPRMLATKIIKCNDES